MSHLLHLATTADIDRLLAMIAAYHAEEGIDASDEHRRAAVLPLLEGSPHGAVWLVGPRMSPVGYIAIAFGWSIELGGLEGFVDEFWIREKVRGKGMGGEALQTLMKTLRESGVRALHLEVAPESAASRLYRRLGFQRRSFSLMSWTA